MDHPSYTAHSNKLNKQIPNKCRFFIIFDHLIGITTSNGKIWFWIMNSYYMNNLIHMRNQLVEIVRIRYEGWIPYII